MYYKGICSAATDGVHDLDPIALSEPMMWVTAAWDDLFIDLHRNTAFAEGQRVDQLGGGIVLGDGTLIAIDDDFHVHSVKGQACGRQSPLP